jgi:hypothetical protein
MNIVPLKGFQNTSPELRKKGIVITTEGRSYDLFNFNADDHPIEQTGRQLSRLSRYNGNTRQTYNVAQHCVMGSNALMLCGLVKEAFVFLLHDETECITNDVNPIIKRQLGSVWTEIEDDISMRFAKKHGIPFPYPEVIHTIDKSLAQFEMSMLIKSDFAGRFDYWNEHKAEAQFLYTYDMLKEMLTYQETAIV